MLDFIKKHILQIHIAAGVEVVIRDNDHYEIYGTISRLHKNKITHEPVGLIKTISSLKENINPKIPISLIINGKGVLTRKVATNANIADQILPGINSKDFFEEVLLLDFPIGSIIRKDKINRITEELKNQGFIILNASIGPQSIETILPLISAENIKRIETTTHIIDFNETNGIKSIEDRSNAMDNPEYALANQYVRASHLLAFAGSVSILSNRWIIDKTPSIGSVSDLVKKYKGQKLFNAIWKGAVSLLFLLFLINFLIYNYYFQKNNSLRSFAITTRDQENQSQRFSKKVSAKESFLQQTGWTHSFKKSFIADRVAGMVPASAFLTALNICPYKGDFNEQNTTGFKSDTIEISGVSENIMVINQFINNIKNIQEIRDVNLKAYQYNKETKNGSFDMEIIMK